MHLAHSIDRDKVLKAYASAGLTLSADLQTLARAPRVAGDHAAAAHLSRNITLTDRHHVPVLTLHTTGDGVAPVEQEQAYAAKVRATDSERYVRQLFVARAGHGTFTAAEEITAIQALLQRLQTGQWGSLAPSALNQRALALGPALNVRHDGGPLAPRFTVYRPPAYALPLSRRSGLP